MTTIGNCFLAACCAALLSASVWGAGINIEAGKEKGTITYASFERIVKEDPGALMLIDTRSAKQFAAGTVKGAINIPVDELEKKLATLPKDKPIVFICATGAQAGEAYDTAKLLRPELQVYFLDAAINYHGDGGFSLKK